MEAVIFDYDGTLVHLNIDFGLMRKSVEAFLAECGVDPAGLKGFYILEMIEEATGLISERNPLAGSDFYQKSIGLVTEHEIRAAKHGKILPGVIEMLEVLGNLGIKVGIITRNCDEAVKMVFPHIENFCDAYFPRDNITRVKPHPDHLARALKKVGIGNRSRSLMVGDHVLDIEVGKCLEIKTAGVLTGKTTRRHFIEAGADYILDDVTKILDHIL